MQRREFLKGATVLASGAVMGLPQIGVAQKLNIPVSVKKLWACFLVISGLLLAGIPTVQAATVKVAISNDTPQIQYALRQLGATLQGLGNTLVILATNDPTPPDLVVANGSGGALGSEDFSLGHSNSTLVLNSGGSRGAMYGILDVNDQISLGTALGQITNRTVNARLPFRAIKFNLPYASYRNGPSVEAQVVTCADTNFWASFLDTMAKDRFNTLTLWSLHPFHYFIVPTNYPEAQTFSNAEMAQWRTLWTSVFAMAKERGIETFVLNWNIFVSPAFSTAHNVATYSQNWSSYGNGDTNPIIIDYTRQCVSQIIDEYPDLTGLGTFVGERMGGMTGDEERAWIKNAIFDGIAAAHRPIKFIYRSSGVSSVADELKTRGLVESLTNNPNVIKPAYMEFKFNWSHGHAATNLFMVHGGTPTGTFWRPSPLTNTYQIIWTARNEDFAVLRWCEPDFMRQFILNNAKTYVSGVIIGSEVFIPGADYMSLNGPHKNWTYDFERKWLFWRAWGNLLHDTNTPDTFFASLLGQRFGTNQGADLMQAWKLVSRAPLRFASFHKGTWDGDLYSEAFASWGSGMALFDINQFISAPVLDTLNYVNISDFVNASNTVPVGKISPLVLSTNLENEANQALQLVANVRARTNGVSPTLDCELKDIEAWSAYSHYFAQKLRGGVALANYRKFGNPTQQTNAVTALQQGLIHWRTLSQVTTNYYLQNIPFISSTPFSWAALTPAVSNDIVLASTVLAPPTVSFSTPTNGQNFAAPASLYVLVNASQPSGNISSVRLYVNGAALHAEGGAPYQWSNTSDAALGNMAAGIYSLMAVATDNYGATNSATITVSVGNPPPVPLSVTITQPVSGATFAANANINLAVTTTSGTNAVVKVEYFAGTNKLGESLSSPFGFTWTNVATGNYSITARATDAGSNNSTSAPVSISVSGPAGGAASVVAYSLASTWTTVSGSVPLTASGGGTFTIPAVPSPASVNGMLVVTFSGEVSGDPTVTWGGVTMTNATSKIVGSGNNAGYSGIFYLPSPTAGTGPLNITYSGTRGCAYAVYATGITATVEASATGGANPSTSPLDTTAPASIAPSVGALVVTAYGASPGPGSSDTYISKIVKFGDNSQPTQTTPPQAATGAGSAAASGHMIAGDASALKGRTTFSLSSSGNHAVTIASFAPAPAATAINITYSVSGGSLILNWPSGQGWQLQAQTNPITVGLRTNWVTVPGAVPPLTNVMNPASGTVFYRLVHP